MKKQILALDTCTARELVDAPKQKLSQSFMIWEKESQEMVQVHANWVQRYSTESEGAD